MTEELTTAQFPTGDSELWSAAVGKNGSYYLPRFAQYLQGVASFPSWHWPALFVPFLWALYRKAWLGALLLLILPVVISLLPPLAASLLWSSRSTASTLAYWVGIALAWIVPPTLANGIYFRLTRKRVQEARVRFPEPVAQVAYLTARGGTSGGIALIAVVLGLVALTGVLAAIAIPAYQDYVVRAKVTEAIASVEPLKAQVEASWSKDQSIPDQLDYADLENTSAGKYLRSVKLDKDNGTLTLVFKNLTSNADGKSIHLVPSSRNDAPMRWQCRNIDMPPHFLVASCRQP